MNILAFDSSMGFCTVALCYEGKVFHKDNFTAMSQAELLVQLIEDVMKEAKADYKKLDAIAVEIGRAHV